MEDRVKRVRVGVRDILSYLHQQHGLPNSVVFNRDSKLPDGFKVVAQMPQHLGGGMFIDFVVQHPSWDPVPNGAEIPMWEPGDTMRWMYSLATEAEVAARPLGGDSPTAQPTKTWREQPPML
jgi:hypothetical protein